MRTTAPHMPPSGKLPDTVIADFERGLRWARRIRAVEAPAVSTSAASSQYKGMSIEEGRRVVGVSACEARTLPQLKDARAAKGWSKDKD